MGKTEKAMEKILAVCSSAGAGRSSYGPERAERKTDTRYVLGEER
jgi:hypothetical protein